MATRANACAVVAAARPRAAPGQLIVGVKAAIGRGGKSHRGRPCPRGGGSIGGDVTGTRVLIVNARHSGQN